MKKVYIAILIVVASILIFLIGIMAFFINKGSFGIDWGKTFGNLEIVKDSSYSIDNVKKIEVDLSFDNVKLLKNTSDEIRIVEYMNRKDEKLLAKTQTTEDTFIIYKNDMNLNFNFNFLSRIERTGVSIPHAFRLVFHFLSGRLYQ